MAARRASRRTRRRTARRRTTRRRTTRRRSARRRVVRRRRKARRVSTRGKKFQVFRGTRAKTVGGLEKSDLMKNKNGKKMYKKYLSGWNNALMKARKSLGVTGFVAVKKGSKLYKATMKIYKK